MSPTQPPDSAIGRYLDAAAAAIRAGIPALKTVEATRGDVTAERIRKLSIDSPAVLVACRSFDGAMQCAEGIAVDLEPAAFVVATDRRKKDSRTAVASGIAEAIARWIPGWVPGAGLQAELAVEIAGRNLFSGELDDKGVALWAVFWKQRLYLEETEPAPAPWVPSSLWTQWGDDDTEVEIR